MSAFVGTVGAFVRGRYTGANDLSSVAAEIAKSFEADLVAGTGSGAADLMFADTRSIALSSSESLDLAGGVSDALGVVSTFVDVKAILIKAKSTNVNNVVVGNAASNDFIGPLSADATVTLPPGGILALIHPGAGWTVTASTGDLLKIANSGAGTAVVYDIVIIGASA